MKKSTLIIAVGGEKKPRKNSIELPKEFDDPKIDIGETFEAVATIRREKGGYCVEALDGVPMEKDKSEESEEEPETLGAGARQAMGGY